VDMAAEPSPPEPPQAEPEPEPELVSAVTEPVLSAFAEPVSFDEQDATAATVPPPPVELEPAPEPPPPTQTEPEPAPQPVAASSFQEPVATTPPAPLQAVSRTPGVGETLVAWPSGSPTSPPGNGAPAEAAWFEEATSVIPAWQPTEADSKQTVSMQAMPLEEVASGAGFAAVLTFESGP